MSGAGRYAYTEKFTLEKTGLSYYVIHCRLCEWDGVRYSTRMTARRLFGRGRREKLTYPQAMTVWVTHLALHHPDVEAPKWTPPLGDIPDNLADVERAIFDLTPQERLLNALSESRRGE